MTRASGSRLTDPHLEALWKRVLDAWEDEAAHGAFLEHCQATDQLIEAAVRYRGMAGDRDRGATAEGKLQGVTLLALSRLETARTSTGEARGHAGRLILVLFFMSMSVALMLYALR